MKDKKNHFIDSADHSFFLKKLLYQSCNRGCKETDLIIGGFAKQNLNKMNNEELQIFAAILNLPDADIYDWYTKKIPIPSKYDNIVLKKLLEFIPLPSYR